MRFFTALLLLITTISTHSSAQVLPVALHHFGVDETDGFVLSRADLALANAGNSGNWEAVDLDGRRFDFADQPEDLAYGVDYTVQDAATDQEYTLMFTELPLVHLNPVDSIPDEFKRPAYFSYADDETTFTALCGAEIRGGYTSTLAKKTYDLEFWTDESGEDNTDVTFPGLRSDDDWILDAVYNEPLRVNAFVGHNLWLDAYELPYADDEPEAKSGPGVRWCEVFKGGEYWGVYFISEQVDRKQLKLKKYNESSDRVRGELYKTFDFSPVTQFEGLPDAPDAQEEQWQGVEAKYPKDDGRWGTIYNMMDFAINSTDEELSDDFDDWFDADNLANYLIFVNLITAGDNNVKNIFYARYDDDEPYLMIPWDLDGTFGNHWDGSNTGYPADYLISNDFQDRLIAGNIGDINESLCDEFTALRAAGIYTMESFTERLNTQYTYLKENGVYVREERRWPGSVRAEQADFDRAISYTAARYDHFSNWFCDLPVSTSRPDGLADAELYPNPAAGAVYLKSPFNEPQPWSLYDLTGRRVAAGQLNALQTTLDLKPPGAGQYVLRLGGRAYKLIIR